MAAPRKRSASQGFSLSEEDPQMCEPSPTKETPDSSSREMFETFSHIAESHSQEIEEIIPTEDPGPRFIDAEPLEATPPSVPGPQTATPKRHPRNIPKFSRIKRQ